MKKFIFIIFLLLSACGYQSVNKIDKSNYNISKYEFIGNQQVNKILKRNFERNKNNTNSENEFEIIATSNLVKSKNSKDQSGEATNLSLEIIVDLDIFQNDKKIKKITINENTNYKSGITGIYNECKCNVLPVALNSGCFWQKGKITKNPGKIIIKFLEVIPSGLEKSNFLKILEKKIEKESAKIN